MSDYVSWQDYEGLASASVGGGAIGGISDSRDVSELTKALTAGHDINAPATAAGDGFPLRLESLDSTLFNLTYKAQDVKFWRALSKDSAFNTIEEFNQLTSYGAGSAAFIAEGDLPVEDDSTYVRNYTKIKFMGTVRRVSHVLSLLKAAHGDIIARETVNGTLFLMRQLERNLFDGNEDLVSVQFNGLEKLLTTALASGNGVDGQSNGYADDNVIDMRGAPLTEDHIADLTERLISEPNYGAPSDLWMPPGPMKDLSKILYPKERYDLPAPSGGLAGIAIKGIATPFGNIALNPDIFIPTSTLAPTSPIGPSATRPATPSAQSTAAAGEATSLFVAADAGTYQYKLVAGNRYGKSTFAQATAATVTAGDKVTIVVRDSPRTATFYEVYRGVAGGAVGTERLVMKVPANASGQDTTIVDINRFLPGTTKSYMLTQTSEVLKIKQLAPYTKIPLATIDTSIRWAQVIYLALQLMAPQKNGMFINVGALPTGVNG